MNQMKNILLAILGESPGVLTETLWALALESPDLFPDEISIMTTCRGRDVLRRQLPARIIPTLVRKLEQKIDRPLPLPYLKLNVFPTREGLEELTDLQSRSDTEIAGDEMLRWVRGYAFEDNTRILASLSGGRKSMTSLLTTCMTLLGKPEDRMFHVHVPPPYDRPLNPPFLYPGQTSEHKTPDGTTVPGDNIPITLIDMPFIPLHLMYRTYWGKSTASFSDMVAAFQKALDPYTLPSIRLNCKTHHLSWDAVQISLSDFDTDFLSTFWKTKPFPTGWHVLSDTLDAEDCRKAAERIRRKLKSENVPIPEIQRLLPKFRGDPHPPHWPPKGLTIR